jgi:Sporulation and spore germination.
MNRILDALRRFFSIVWQTLVKAWGVSLRWLSVPFNLCFAILALVFVVSFSSWAIGSRFESALLYFPDSKGALRGEVRSVPHSWGAEARAELIASEVLLGPKTAELKPDFVSDVRVESVLYRKGRLFVDISPSAAVADSKANPPDTPLAKGIEAMERSIRAALPTVRRITLTIGGKEPYSTGLKAVEGGSGIKKAGK